MGNDFMKVLTLIVGAGIVTSLVLPGRQTPAVIEKFWGGFSKAVGTATGQPVR